MTSLVEKSGSDVWWTADVSELLPPSLAHLAPDLVKGEDTMDVWFDSGSSWAGVLRARAGEGLTFPADLYLEGSDQHRGTGVVVLVVGLVVVLGTAVIEIALTATAAIAYLAQSVMPVHDSHHPSLPDDHGHL